MPGHRKPCRDAEPTGGGSLSLGDFRLAESACGHILTMTPRPADVVLDISRAEIRDVQGMSACPDKSGGTVQFQVLVDGKVRERDPCPARFESFKHIAVDVAGAKEVVLRVLNGGDGGSIRPAVWGFARFVEAGAEDPLEEPPGTSIGDRRQCRLLPGRSPLATGPQGTCPPLVRQGRRVDGQEQDRRRETPRLPGRGSQAAGHRREAACGQATTATSRENRTDKSPRITEEGSPKGLSCCGPDWLAGTNKAAGEPSRPSRALTGQASSGRNGLVPGAMIS